MGVYRFCAAVWTLIAVAAAGLTLAGPASAGGLGAPTLTTPVNGQTVDAIPAFTWTSVSGADHYQFEIAADAGFGSPLTSPAIMDTANTVATMVKTEPNGTYYWRVRSVTASGVPSGWSPSRSVTVSWIDQPVVEAPGNGATVTYPTDVIRLSWLPVPHAVNYQITIARDPHLSTPISSQMPFTTQATAYTPHGVLTPGTYYWAVTPVDAEGDRGTPSTVASFVWSWPSQTTTTTTNINPSWQNPHWLFSWVPVPGAAYYTVTVASAADFSAGSIIPCSCTTTGTSVAATNVLANNTYYWRVQPFDVNADAGQFSSGGSFQQAFDNTANSPNANAIQNLRMVNAGTSSFAAATGFVTDTPLVQWDAVPGASDYEVVVEPFVPGLPGFCASGTAYTYDVLTSTPAWTPLGAGGPTNPPFPWSGGFYNYDFRRLYSAANNQTIDGSTFTGRWCLKVRAVNHGPGAASDAENGSFTWLDTTQGIVDTNDHGWAFHFTGYGPNNTHDAAGCNCTPQYLATSDYLRPQTGSTAASNPIFTWNPRNAYSWFVVVAKDPQFTEIVDYGFTQVPAYAPRKRFQSAFSYADETTSLYWAVLPAADYAGTIVQADPVNSANPQQFNKQSPTVTLISPSDGAAFTNAVNFAWSDVLGAKYYQLQVATDPTFSSMVDDVTTDSTSYTSEKTYPASSTLYWRVRALADPTLTSFNDTGLSWSASRTIQQSLAAPTVPSTNPPAGSLVPNWLWNPVAGAVAYDVQLDGPPGTQHRQWDTLPSGGFNLDLFAGTGVFTWSVRAEFPTGNQYSPSVTGAWSAPQAFTRTIPAPTDTQTQAGAHSLLLAWSPVAGERDYRVQLATGPDFSTADTILDQLTDTTNLAPLMSQPGFLNGGLLYWRVAARDQGQNVGAFSAAQTITLARHLFVTANGFPTRGRSFKVTITVRDGQNRPVAGVAVRVSGVRIRAHGVTARRGRGRGTVTFVLVVRRRGVLTFTALRRGYLAGTLTMTVH